MKKTAIIGTSAVLMSLMTTAPLFALAHDGHDHDAGFGARIEANVAAKVDAVTNWFDHKKESGESKKHSDDGDKSGIAFRGTVSLNASSTLTVLGSDGKTYTVDAASATIKSVSTSTPGAITVAQIKLQDPVFVAGYETGTTTVKATIIVVGVFGEKIHGKGKNEWKKFDGVAKGVVTSVNGNTITILNKKTGTTTVVTDSNTAFRIDGATTTSGSVTVGAHVGITGTTTATSTVPASIVDVFTKGFKKFVHVCFGWMGK